MRFIHKVLATCAGLIAFACASCSAPMPDATAAVQSDTDAYFVLGVQPKNMMLQIDQAIIKDKRVEKIINELPLHLYGQTAGDFVVVKAKGGTRLIIQSASIMAGHSIFGVLYRPCKETIAFEAPVGKVVYITNLSYTFTGLSGMNSTYRQDMEAAKEYMTLHYPLLADKLEQGRFDIVQFSGAYCG